MLSTALHRNRKSTQTIMGTSSGLLMLLVCFVNVKIAHSRARLHYQYTPYYNLKWTDEGSGGKQDVSVWTARPFASGFFPVGDTAIHGFSKPQNRAIMVEDSGKGFVQRPLDFKKIWSDVGSGAKKDVTFYKMIPPTGYVCLGHVAVPSLTTKPDPNAYRCVKSDLVMGGYMYPIWNDKGSGAKEDVSLWSVENDPMRPLGMLALTFISTLGHRRPTEQAYVMDSNKVSLHGFNNGSEVAITLYQTGDMTSVWDDKGSGAKKDVSIWKPNYCCSLGYVAVENYLATFAVYAKEVVKGALEKPKGFASFWNDKGSKATRDCSIWRPLCPAKYVALGYAAMTSHTDQPSTEEFRCVHMDYVTPGVWAFVWNSEGSGSKEDVSFWQANHINASGQGIYAMSAVNGFGRMTIPAYVLKSVNVRIQTNKPAKMFMIFDVVYNFDDREILQAEPIKLGARTIVENCHSKTGSPSLVVTRAIAFTKEEEHSWNVEITLEVGITAEVKAGIPDVAEVTTSTSVTTSFTSGEAGRTTESSSDSISAAMEAKPGTSVGYMIMGKKYVMDIPWRGKLKTTFIDDSTQVEDVSGKYYGTQITEYRVTAEAPIECSKTA